MSSSRIAALGCLLVASAAAHATTFVINNTNAAGVGFNDTTPALPVAGNTGITLGEQRLNVFQQAANQWAALLNSNVTIVIDGSMTALTCTATSATLGSAGPNDALANFPGAPRSNTAYNLAEANALAGTNEDPGIDDITAQFNVSLDAGSTSCLGGEKWWYGIDPNVTPAAGTIPLLPVVFHELGHGLGFTANISTTDGSYFTGADTPVWADYLFDTGTNQLWKAMSNGQRLTSTTNDPHLVWTGPRTNKRAGGYLKPNNSLIIHSPAAIAGAQEVGIAGFGPAVTGVGTTGNLVLVIDGTANPTQGCNALSNAAAVAGNIALIDRGTCSFETKVLNAQNAGAIAAIIANNQVDGLRLPLALGPDGSGVTITIPAYSITQALGTTIKGQLGTGVNTTLGFANIGVNQGCVRMFAPAPVLGGSSVSHFHADATPDLLMEPALNTTIFNHVDLTLPFFADIDWSVNNADDFIFFDGFDVNPCQHVQP